MGMKQAKTDYGTRGETGERTPRHATASDTGGERRDKVPVADKERPKAAGETGERSPKGDKSSDGSGERRVSLEGGVGMGMADGIGKRPSSHLGKNDGVLGEVKGSVSERVFHEHVRHGDNKGA